MIDIAENIRQIRGKVLAAAARGGRDGRTVQIIAVTKTRSPEEMLAAVEAGLTDLGENKVQELEEKYAAVTAGVTEMKTSVRWHMIGHLQRNKVKYTMDKVDLIHSVDSFRLAEEIDRRASLSSKKVDILLQVNPAGEESKFGLSASEAPALTGKILNELSNVCVRGLMTVVPDVADPEEVRPYFRTVSRLFDEIKTSLSHERLDMRYLSMGMTHDYEVAVEEGANLIRVGTGIFGPRSYEVE
ncbi:MAG: YggS family pyridoxal phosphate-dependent enzyme [Clostridiales Family XIII bacterium]|jgi:pyridoxal phosphate enzyme (YggS family)|nr:YggS family pyridoxal phosphate-dependent enzyme [Clostridiales Family XIII bacterium]